MRAPVVVPVDVLDGGDLDVVDASSGSAVTDEFGLVPQAPRQAWSRLRSTFVVVVVTGFSGGGGRTADGVVIVGGGSEAVIWLVEGTGTCCWSWGIAAAASERRWNATSARLARTNTTPRVRPPAEIPHQVAARTTATMMVAAMLLRMTNSRHLVGSSRAVVRPTRSADRQRAGRPGWRAWRSRRHAARLLLRWCTHQCSSPIRELRDRPADRTRHLIRRGGSRGDRVARPASCGPPRSRTTA